jgi:hypothetical protein
MEILYIRNAELSTSVGIDVAGKQQSRKCILSMLREFEYHAISQDPPQWSFDA